MHPVSQYQSLAVHSMYWNPLLPKDSPSTVQVPSDLSRAYMPNVWGRVKVVAMVEAVLAVAPMVTRWMALADGS